MAIRAWLPSRLQPWGLTRRLIPFSAERSPPSPQILQRVILAEAREAPRRLILAGATPVAGGGRCPKWRMSK